MISCSPQVSRSSMLREDSRTSPPDARSAVPLRRMHRRVQERCSAQFARTAVLSVRCPLSPLKVKTFSAASASLREELTELNLIDGRTYGRQSLPYVLFLRLLKNTKVKALQRGNGEKQYKFPIFSSKKRKFSKIILYFRARVCYNVYV